MGIQEINKRRNESQERVIEILAEKDQHDKFIELCGLAGEYVIDPSILARSKYNAIIAKTATLYDGVAGPEDKVNAEKNIRECDLALVESKKNLETVLNEIKTINNSNLTESKEDLYNFVTENIKVLDDALEYSKKVLNGKYDEVEDKLGSDIKIENKEVVEVKPTVKEDNNVDLGEKVIAQEPYVEKKPEEEKSVFEDLNAELDEAIKPVHDDITDLKIEMDNIDNEVKPEEEDIVAELEHSIEASDVFNDISPLTEEEESPLSFVNEKMVSAASVDEGPVRVDEVIEVGAPEEEMEEEKAQARRLAA